MSTAPPSTDQDPRLPPGWTLNMALNAFQYQEEMNALSEQDQLNLLSVIREHSQRTQAALAASGDIPALPPPEAQSDVVDVVRQRNLSEWGFVVVRTFFGDERKWAEFRRRWGEAIDDVFNAAFEGGGGAIERVRDKLRFLWVEEPALRDASPEAVRSHVNALISRGEVPEGLKVGACLLANKGSVESLVNAPATKPIWGHGEKAWVVAVDLEHQEGSEEWRGHFRVAIGTMLESVWPQLAGQVLTMEEMAATVEGDGEEGVFVFLV